MQNADPVPVVGRGSGRVVGNGWPRKGRVGVVGGRGGGVDRMCKRKVSLGYVVVLPRPGCNRGFQGGGVWPMDLRKSARTWRVCFNGRSWREAV